MAKFVSQQEPFQQPEDGFGFSNFRNENPLPESVVTSSTATYDQFAPETLAENPLAILEYKRHANFIFTEHYPDYQLTDSKQKPPDYVHWNIIKSIQGKNPVLLSFFSQKNVDYLQKLIVYMIYHQSNGAYKISPQREQELLVIMRAIYLQTPFDPYGDKAHLRKEICRLNKNVLDACVPEILVNIQQYLGFIRDHGNTVNPPVRPINMNTAGTRINQGFDANFI